MFRLNAKNINRLAVISLLAAPLLYLFGSMFCALAGAHGTSPFAEDVVVSEEIDRDVVYNGDTYKRGIYNGSTLSIKLDLGIDYTLVFNLDGSPSLVTDAIWGLTCNGFLYDNMEDEYWGIGNNGDSIYTDETYSESNSNYCFSFLLDSDNYTSYNEVFYNPSHGGTWFEYFSNRVENHAFSSPAWDLDGSSYFVMDFTPLEETPYVSPEILSQRRIPAYQPVIQHTEGNPDPTPSDNAHYVFDQFFDKDNFITAMGRDVSASDNPPYGFAPIGALVHYLDASMFHFHETDNTMGLFFYGYGYWACHVVIFDLIVYAACFIPRIFLKILNKLEGMRD